MDPIAAFLNSRELPTDITETRHIKYKVVNYHLVDRILYKRGYTLPYF